MKPRDGIIIGVVLLLAVGTLLLPFLLRSGGGEEDMVVIRVHGELYGSYPLSEERTVLVEQDSGDWNRVHITGEGVCVEDANCANHDCVRMGTLTLESVSFNQSMITCLPHGMTVELVPAA